MITFANPKVWGSSGWVFLHCISNTFPENPSKTEKKQYIDFFISLSNVLPCVLCRNHYKEWLKFHPIQKYVKNKELLKNWIFMMHNYVNFRLQKKLIKDCETSDQLILNYALKNQIFK
jgi:hypothetical protein